MAGSPEPARRDQLAAAVERLRNRGARADSSILLGRADKAIAAYMAGLPGALLVMGAYGHSPLRELIVGSTTTAMIRTARSPVLLVR